MSIMRFSVAFLLLAVVGVRAADPETAKPDSAMEEFKKVHAEFNNINAELHRLQVEYRKATKQERLALDKQWKVKFHEGEEIQARFYKAAEKAFVESPNPDKNITQLLWKIFQEQCRADDFENAARLGKLLIDKKVPDVKINPQAFALLGVACVAVGDFKSATDFFQSAEKDGAFQNPINPKDKLMENAFAFSKNLVTLEENWKKEQQIREEEAKKDDLPRVLIKTESGDIVIELFENEAPNTVANFISLVEKKYYDGLTFHRVLPGFMAQGGDPNGNGSGGPGYSIPDEVSNPAHRKHFRGALSMAKSAQPNSGGSQFFLCFAPTPHLDGIHTVFGRVIEGFDVLSKIRRCDPDDPNHPDPEKIIEMKVLRKRDHEYTVKKTGE